MIAISAEAQSHFAKLLANKPQGTAIRVFVLNPGSAQAECGVSYCEPEAIAEDDARYPYEGFTVVIDPQSTPFLEDSSIDFITDKLGSQLTLKAPNAKARKVGDDAPLADRVEYILTSQINPQLASHGGKVALVELTDDGIAVLQFGGGCNGCSMVDVTLKDGIERELLEKFPGELSGVRDVTEHRRGEHSYY